MNTRSWPLVVLLVAVMATAACGKPGADTLRESFAQQLGANRFIKDFQRIGDDLTFSGPGAEGGVAKWRVHINAAIIEANNDAAQPYRGIVQSSWYSDNQLVKPSGRDSNLPIELMDNGLTQDCWAFWNKATKRWSWE
jgi:hypothetical protein